MATIQPAPRAGLQGGTLWTLLAGNALTEVGVGFFLPILPLFIRSRGGSALLVGLIFASGVVARAVAQYPAGWLSDRFGRRPIIIGSLLVYAALFPLYALPIPVAALMGLRFVQALAGGAYQPAAFALAADLSPAAERGRVYSKLRASDMVGLLLGPALGGFVAGFRLEYVFVAGAVICLAAALLLTRLPSVAPTVPLNEAEREPPVDMLRLIKRLLPVIALGAPTMWVFGTYDSIWSLYISSRGASTFLVGVSFATYALPVVLFAGLAGGLADRLGAMRAGSLALLTFGLLALTYPFIASVPLLIGIGFLEGTLTAAGQPALNAEVSRLAPAGAQGRTQGTYLLVLSAAQVVGAVASGWLYGFGPVYAFASGSAMCLIGVAAGALLMRKRAA
jgi:MFS family permease